MIHLKQCVLGILCLVACAAFSGCAGWVQQLDRTLGNLSHEYVMTLGSPSKQCSLVRLRISGAYAIVMQPKYIIHIGEEYTAVRAVKQFSDSGTDYVVLACRTEDGSLQNMLAAIPASATQTELYLLSSTSNSPFSTAVVQNSTTLFQDGDSPDQLRVWFLEKAGLRGPMLITRAQLDGSGKKEARVSGKADKTSSSARTRTPPPVITPQATARPEDESPRTNATAKPAEQSGSGAAPSAPAIVIGTPSPAAPKAADTPAAKPGQAEGQKPVIVID